MITDQAKLWRDSSGILWLHVDFTDVVAAKPGTVSVENGKGYTLNIKQLSTYRAKKVEWLWEPYIPKGMVTVMTGDPGSLKSYLALAICAQVTTGDGLEGKSTRPGSCLYLTNENDPETVIRPRFDSLGGNHSNLFLVEGAQVKGKAHHLTLADVDMLEDAVTNLPGGCRVLVIDPLQSYLGAAVDAWRSNQIRPVLEELAKLTRKHGVATIIIRHARKSGGTRAIHRGLDSIDITGCARSELLVGSTADGKQRGMVHIKSNVGIYGPPIAFRVLEGGLAGHFEFLGETDLTASDLSEPEKAKDTALGDAEEFLAEVLREGEVPATEIEKERKIRGIAHKTLCRAKQKLGIKSRRLKGKNGVPFWLWQMPDEGGHD